MMNEEENNNNEDETNNAGANDAQNEGTDWWKSNSAAEDAE